MRGKNTRASRRSRKVAAANKADGRHTPEEDRNWVVTTPRRVASDLSLLGLETDIKPHMLDVIHRGMNAPDPSSGRPDRSPLPLLTLC
jgi:hypothetical protein